MDLSVVDRSATTGASALHDAVPGAKLVAVACVLLAVTVGTNLLVVTAVALALAGAVLALGLPAKRIFVLAAYPGLFAAIFAFAATPGWLASALIVMKAVTAALGAVVLMFTTPYPQVFAPVQRLMPAIVGDALLMTYRSLFLLLEKFAHTLTAARLRAGVVGHNPVSSAGTITRSLGAVLLYSVDLSQRTHDIMHLRGYDGRLAVTPQPSRSRGLDTAVVVSGVIVACVAIAWRVAWRALGPFAWLPAVAGAAVFVAGLLAFALRKGPPMTTSHDSDNLVVLGDSDAPECAHGHEHVQTPAYPDEVARVSCVRHRYEDGVEVLMCGLDVVARKGQRIAVLGPNGSGKTTLLFHLLGLLRSEEGIVEVFGVDPARNWKDIRKRIGVVLQNVDEQILAPTVLDDVGFSPRQYGLPEAEVRERVDRALSRVGIPHLAERVPHNLSGGEKRKVALAGALVMDPELLVLDEPFEGLDPASRGELIGLIGDHAEKGGTVIMSTHDIDTVPEFADYCYVMASGGAIVMKGTPGQVFGQVDTLAAGNIKPPLLAEMFTRLKELDPDAPEPALTVDAAIEALVRWKRGGS